MIHRIPCVAAWATIACLGLAAAGATAQEEATDAKKTAVDPVKARRRARAETMTADALESLKQAADFLAGQKRYSFGADTSYDVLQPNGQMLEFGGTRDVLVRRPDRLRVESVARDGEVKLLFFDGQSILVDIPDEDAYMRAEKPGTLYAAVDYLVDDLGVPSPLEDFMSENFAANVDGRIQSAFYVEHVEFGDRTCEHLAFRTKEVDFQIWLEAGEKPLPCRLVITYKHAAGQPQFTAHFRDWNLAPKSDDELFRFEPPESAERLQIQALASGLVEQSEGK